MATDTNFWQRFLSGFKIDFFKTSTPQLLTAKMPTSTWVVQMDWGPFIYYVSTFCLLSVLKICLRRGRVVQKAWKCANVIFEWSPANLPTGLIWNSGTYIVLNIYLHHDLWSSHIFKRILPLFFGFFHFHFHFPLSFCFFTSFIYDRGHVTDFFLYTFSTNWFSRMACGPYQFFSISLSRWNGWKMPNWTL